VAIYNASVNLLAEHLQFVNQPEQAEFAGLLVFYVASVCASRKCQFGDRCRAVASQDWLDQSVPSSLVETAKPRG
jgi:hypothetical protein